MRYQTHSAHIVHATPYVVEVEVVGPKRGCARVARVQRGLPRPMVTAVLLGRLKLEDLCRSKLSANLKVPLLR